MTLVLRRGRFGGALNTTRSVKHGSFQRVATCSRSYGGSEQSARASGRCCCSRIRNVVGTNSGPVTRHLAAYWLKEAFERGKITKPKGGLWHMFRRAWATERKDLPLKDVAAAGGWRDTSTLLRYQQPDDETLRAVVEFDRPRGRAWFDLRRPPNRKPTG